MNTRKLTFQCTGLPNPIVIETNEKDTLRKLKDRIAKEIANQEKEKSRKNKLYTEGFWIRTNNNTILAISCYTHDSLVSEIYPDNGKITALITAFYAKQDDANKIYRREKAFMYLRPTHPMISELITTYVNDKYKKSNDPICQSHKKKCAIL